jgi:hypothetical protein
MYDAVEDPYCYPGTTVLKNKLNLREQAELDAFEAEITAQRAEEPLPSEARIHALQVYPQTPVPGCLFLGRQNPQCEDIQGW